MVLFASLILYSQGSENIQPKKQYQKEKTEENNVAKENKVKNRLLNNVSIEMKNLGAQKESLTIANNDEKIEMKGMVEDVVSDNKVTMNTSNENVKPECSICLQELVDPNLEIYKTKCNHEFHFECLTNWLKTKLEALPCPICRKELEEFAGKLRKPPEKSIKIFSRGLIEIISAASALLQPIIIFLSHHVNKNRECTVIMHVSNWGGFIVFIITHLIAKCYLFRSTDNRIEEKRHYEALLRILTVLMLFEKIFFALSCVLDSFSILFIFLEILSYFFIVIIYMFFFAFFASLNRNE
jgi:hypothetical protein